jgi:hypothetical protein
MSETRAPAESGQKQITELRVSGHLMTLDTGTFCVFHAPGSATGGDNALGLPGVRISLPPGPAHHPDQVSISTFRPDGWLGGSDAAALIRVASGPAQVLVTIYQAPDQGAQTAPRLQVLRLSPEPSASALPAAIAAHSGNGAAPKSKPEVLVHVQATGDVAGRIGEWAGIRASRSWIEGFSILPPAPLKPEDIEYQAVLGRNWLSPWVNGGQFCGSRGMALPLLGLRVRLKGDAAKQYDCVCQASFVDGTEIGPLPAGAACEAESLAPLEAFQITLAPNAPANDAQPAKNPAQKGPPAKSTPLKSAPLKPAPVKAAPVKPAAKPAAKTKPMNGPKHAAPAGRRAR